MIADIGTRKGAKLEDADENLVLINGFNLIYDQADSFPTKSLNDVRLSSKEIEEIRSETAAINTTRKKIQVIILKVFLMKYVKEINFTSTWLIEMDFHSKLS